MDSDDPLGRLSATITGYDAVAKQYAGKWFHFDGLNRRLKNFASCLEEGTAILDGGCGPGRDAAVFRQLGFDVVGVDLSRCMLEQAAFMVPDGLFRRMDVRRLRYPDQCFGGIWSSGVLHHLTESQIDQALSEFARVLKPAGLIALAVKTGSGERTDAVGRYTRCVSESIFIQQMISKNFEILERSVDEVPAASDYERKTWLWIIARLRGSTRDHDDRCLLCVQNGFRSSRLINVSGTGAIAWGSSELYLVPDLAPIRLGHTLLSTTEHVACFAELGPERLQHVDYIRSIVIDGLQSLFTQPVMSFEHGPATCTGHGGGCVDHAHLHLLPVSSSVRTALDGRLGHPDRVPFRSLHTMLTAGRSYLYMADQSAECCYRPAIVPSQLIRRMLSATPERLNGRKWQDAARDADVAELRRRTTYALFDAVDTGKIALP